MAEEMIYIPMRYSVDLDKTINTTPLNTLFAMGDNQAHRFELTITHGSVAVDLTGCTVKGKFVSFSNNMTVNLNGSVTGGNAVVTLTQACYAQLGRFALVIQIIKDSAKTSVFYGDGYMRSTTTDNVIDGNYIVYDINVLLSKIQEIENAISAANDATSSANAAASSANAWSNATATATALAAGSAPTVSVGTSGGKKVLKLGIPKGDRGDKGEKGDKGDTGETGPTGKSGVAVSETEPTDPEITVWINPEGGADDIGTGGTGVSLDPTLTQSNMAAPASAAGAIRDDVAAMFTGLSAYAETARLTADDFTYGFVNGSTGAVSGQKNRAVTVDFIPDGVTRIECTSPYQMRVSAWVRETGAFLGNWNGSGWANVNTNHSAFDAFVPENKYKICVVNTADSANYEDFTGVAESVALISEGVGGTRAEVVDALRRKTVKGTSLMIADSIAGAPMACTCDGPITRAGLNLSPVSEVSFTGQYKQVTLKTPLPAGTYRFAASCESTDTDDTNSRVRIGSSVWISQKHDGARYSAKFTLAADVDVITFYSSTGAASGTGDSAFWREIMIVSGTEDRPFEPPAETVTCDAGELTLLAQTNILTADTPVEITYIQRSDFIDSLLSATKAAELNAQTLGYVTPEMLGAAGDGVADDTAAVQACIDLAAELGLPAKMLRTYLISGGIVIGSNGIAEINEMKCTGSRAAVSITGQSNSISIRRLTAGGDGILLISDSTAVSCNRIILGEVLCGANCIVLRGTGRDILTNYIQFRRLNAGGDGYCCILSERLELTTNVAENVFVGGRCSNADWAGKFITGGGNSKLMYIQVETNIKGGFSFTGAFKATIIGDRHGESQRDGEYPFIKLATDSIVTTDAQSFGMLRYISAQSLNVNEIDVSDVPKQDESGDYLRSNGSLGVIDCRISSYCETGSDNPKNSQMFGERALIWGPCLIFQGAPEKYWQVTESLDLRTITADTPAMPTVFDIACENAEIDLHPTYCFMGISRFEVMQPDAAHTATIRDYYTGGVVFDGPALGAGEYEVRTFLNGNAARLNGDGMIWRVRRLDGSGSTPVVPDTPGEEVTLSVDGSGNATISGATLTVDDGGNATLAGAALTVDSDGNATIG